ncbi:MAG: hypothetical protein Q4D27_01385 [Coriobacteriia bacterium]|nr:hypothetical protein [Coriobacteriia bacterium]
MNEIRRYEIQGTAAMACKEYQRGESALIDYEVARRSYEARVRLAQRQAAGQRSMSRHESRQQVSHVNRRSGHIGLQDAVRRSYTPHQSVSRTVSNMWEQAVHTVANHPFWYQLKNGTTAGRETGKATYKQVFTSATVCMALSAVMVFVGA